LELFYPIALRETEKRFIELLRQERITSLDLLRAEYTHWPPRGLDADPALSARLDQEVKILPQMSGSAAGYVINEKGMEDVWNRLHDPQRAVVFSARAYGLDLYRRDMKKEYDPARIIYLNNMLFSGPGQIILQCMMLNVSYQVFHALAGLATLSLSLTKSLSILTLFAGLMAGSGRHALLQGLFGFANPALFPNRISPLQVGGHEGVHVLQLKDRHAKGRDTIPQASLASHVFQNAAQNSLSAGGRAMAGLDSWLSLSKLSYLADDLEIQARLHTVIASGYPRWERVPRTRHEFYAALADSGIYVPRTIRAAVAKAAKTEPGIRDFQKRSAFSRLAAALTVRAVAELNTAFSHYARMGRRDYLWQDVLPYLYGHYLELCTDPNGRKKMGFKPFRLPQHVVALSPRLPDRIKNGWSAEMPFPPAPG
jgi:hypothetical protein